MHVLILQNVIKSNSDWSCSSKKSKSLQENSGQNKRTFCILAQTFMFFRDWCISVTLTRRQAQSRGGQRPQEIQLGLQGDPLLVDHLQPSETKTWPLITARWTRDAPQAVMTSLVLFAMVTMVEKQRYSTFFVSRTPNLIRFLFRELHLKRSLFIRFD